MTLRAPIAIFGVEVVVTFERPDGGLSGSVSDKRAFWSSPAHALLKKSEPFILDLISIFM